MRVRIKNDLSKWQKSREGRIRPEGMTRNEWRKLGSARRKAMIIGMYEAFHPQADDDSIVTCPHGLRDGVNCLTCDTDGAAESQGYGVKP